MKQTLENVLKNEKHMYVRLRHEPTDMDFEASLVDNRTGEAVMTAYADCTIVAIIRLGLYLEDEGAR